MSEICSIKRAISAQLSEPSVLNLVSYVCSINQVLRPCIQLLITEIYFDIFRVF